MRKIIQIGFFITFPLFATILWIFSTPLSSKFANMAIATKSLGQITGILGITLFSTTLILQARFSFLENLFKGLNKVYFYHHTIGAVSFILLLFHPIFLAINLAYVSFEQSALFILPNKDVPVNLGKLSLGLMIMLLVLTFFIKIAYDKWKLTHKFLGIAYIFGLVHSLLVPSDISNFIPLKIFILFIGFLAIYSYIYRLLRQSLFKKVSFYKVVNINKEKNKIWEIEMEPLGERINFIPGQFVFVSFKSIDKGKESHPFSITSSMKESNLRIAIKESGDWTQKINFIKKGDMAEVEGPYGRFYSQSSIEKVFIAGGIGIAPLLSMLRTGVNTKVYLFYSIKDEYKEAFSQELKEISRNNKNILYFPHYSSIENHLSIGDIKNKVKTLRNKEFLICGPKEMIYNIRNQLIENEVNKKMIFSEEFQF